jgi:LmbE family N-acetylglucosaminyl deacetylase
MNCFSRRKLLSNTVRLAAAVFVPAVVNAEKREPAGPTPQGRKLKVVVAGGHPGDPEYGCGGTVARYTDLGHEVVLLYLNRGEGGSPKLPPGELGALRTTEAKKACEILKARPAFAGQFDGKPIVDAAHYEEFRKILEGERPDVLFTQWPIDNHPDHRATSMLAYEAWLRMGKSFGFYYYEVSDGEDTQMFSPTAYVDIIAVEPRKRAACYAHASQTPDRYYALETEVARFRGIESGHAQAEAFIRHAQSPADLLPA